MAAIAPPKAIDPVSPIKTLAGWALNLRNPRQAPVKAPENITMLSNPKFKATKLKKDETINVTPAANPSRPSVRFTLLVVATTTKIIKGIYR